MSDGANGAGGAPEGVNLLRLKPSGAVNAAWLADDNPTSFIIGPVGSGKTTTGIMKVMREAIRQHRSPVDGVRRFAHCTFGATYTTMVTNYLASWWRYFPKEVGEWTGLPDMRHRLRFNDGDGPIEFDLLVRSLDGNSLEKVTRGLELTSASLFEADLMPVDAVGEVFKRTARFPGNAPHGKPKQMRLWGELNMPPEDHEWYDLLLGPNRNENHAVYVQPGGLDPQAENRDNLPDGYYEQILEVMEPSLAQRFVHNRPTIVKAGTPVYPEFNPMTHAASYDLDVLDQPLIIGADQGLHAAFVIMQKDHGGQIRVQDEVVAPDEGEDVMDFGERVRDLLAHRYRGLPIRNATLDPAAWSRDSLNAARNWAKDFSQITGIQFRPCVTNDPAVRQSALRTYLRTNTTDGRPAILLSRRVMVLRRALGNGYRWLPRSPTDPYVVKVDKNRFSHIAEALEYALVGATGVGEALERRGVRATQLAPVVAPSSFAVF